MIHEDNRRILEDWPEAKLITVKEDCILGNHYHKIKTEKFILVEGSCFALVDNNEYIFERGKLYTIYPGQLHQFELTAGSLLIGICSHAFNPEDDYKL